MTSRKLTNTDIATIRTTVNAGITSFIVWGAAEIFDVHIDVTNPVVIALGAAAVGVGYRASREAAARWPALGRILFGIPSDPSY